MQEDQFIDVARDTKRAKARMDAKEWRDKFNKWNKVSLNPKQTDFENCTAKFCYFRAGNQSGKSYSAGDLITQTALGRYRNSYEGFKPKLRTEAAYAVVIWILSTTGQMVRDGLQTILFGDVAGGAIGTGLLPRDCIKSIQMGRGIAGAIDYAVIERDDGLLCKIGFKTYEQGRAAVQAEPVSLVCCDELLDDLPMWNELIARTTATQGIVRLTATERLQSSPVALWFRDNAGPDCVTITGSVDDATHISVEDKAAIKASYKTDAELKTRYYGLPFEGGGSVFATPISTVMEKMEPASFPVWYKYGIALDLSHFGRGENSSQFAAVFMAYDPLTKVVRIFDAFKMRGIVEEHVARIRNAGGECIIVFWPHDGTQGQADGGNIIRLYKNAGLLTYHHHATFGPGSDGGYNFESGVTLMDSLLSTGCLKVASHLTAWKDEYLAYERAEDGAVIKRMDDLMSATRIGCMMVRAFRVPDEHRDGGRRKSESSLARGLEFDLFRA